MRERMIQQKNIIYFCMQEKNDFSIFLLDKEELQVSAPTEKENISPFNTLQYSKSELSLYLDQFFDKSIQEKPPEQGVDSQEPSIDKKQSQVQIEKESEEKEKQHTSIFHNFQKHLTVCLKCSITIGPFGEKSSQFEIAAEKLWQAFRQSTCTNKKILHYLIGERSEHKITEEGLKNYGFYQIFTEFGDLVMRQARQYLLQQTLRQILEGKLEKYIKNKKMKQKHRFRKYLEIFVEELKSGFLRRRLPKDKIGV